MRRICLIGLALASWLWVDAATAESGFTPPRPNIVLVIADDLGYGDVGFNGQPHIRTPNLDRMAAEGTVFEQFYAGATVCMPSRASLMTGKHTGRTYNRGNPNWTFKKGAYNFGPDEVTLAEELKRAGYATALFGKWGLAEWRDDANLPTRRGFDTFYGYRGHGAAHHYYPTEPSARRRRGPAAGQSNQGEDRSILARSVYRACAGVDRRPR